MLFDSTTFETSPSLSNPAASLRGNNLASSQLNGNQFVVLTPFVETSMHHYNSPDSQKMSGSQIAKKISSTQGIKITKPQSENTILRSSNEKQVRQVNLEEDPLGLIGKKIANLRKSTTSNEECYSNRTWRNVIPNLHLMTSHEQYQNTWNKFTPSSLEQMDSVNLSLEDLWKHSLPTPSYPMQENPSIPDDPESLLAFVDREYSLTIQENPSIPDDLEPLLTNQMDSLNCPSTPSLADLENYSLHATLSPMQVNLSISDDPEFSSCVDQMDSSTPIVYTPSLQDLANYSLPIPPSPMQEISLTQDTPRKAPRKTNARKTLNGPKTKINKRKYPAWTKEQTQALLASVRKRTDHLINWNEVAKDMEPVKKTTINAYQLRYKYALAHPESNNSKWTEEQAVALLESANKHKTPMGIQWKKVALEMRRVKNTSIAGYKKKYWALQLAKNNSNMSFIISSQKIPCPENNPKSLPIPSLELRVDPTKNTQIGTNTRIPWTGEQMQALIKSVERNKDEYGHITWENVAYEMKNIRDLPVKAYQKKYRHLHLFSDYQQREKSNEQVLATIWTAEKDKALLESVKANVSDDSLIVWSGVVRKMKRIANVSFKSCQNRVYRLVINTILQKEPSNISITTTHAWTEKQDRTLLKSIRTHTDSQGNFQWEKVIKDMQDIRKVSQDACKKRLDRIILKTVDTL